MHTDFAEIPTPVDLISNVYTWSAPFFLALLPYIYVTVGIILAAIIAKWFGQKIIDGVKLIAITWAINRLNKDDQEETTMTGAEANKPAVGQAVANRDK